MDVISAVIISLALAFTGALAKPYVNMLAKRQALKRVNGEPLYVVGAKVDKVIEPTSNALLMRNCVIEDISYGRILLRDEKGRLLPLTVQEFERCHAVMEET